MCSWFSHLSLSALKREGAALMRSELEPRHELFAREHLVVAVRPAEPGEKIDHRVRQIALFLVLHDADGAVPLGELVAVLARARSARAQKPAAHAPSARKMLICRGVLLT